MGRSHVQHPAPASDAPIGSPSGARRGVFVPAFRDDAGEWLTMPRCSERARVDYFRVYRAALRGDLVTRRINGRLYVAASSLAKIAKPAP